MPVAFPSTLRGFIRASKARSQIAPFTVATPRRGPPYPQELGTDVPVIWDVMFRFSTADAAVFQEWFVEDIARGADEFTMPIRTEHGLIEHTCLFLADGLLNAREVGEVWEYTARVLARALVVPA